MIALSLLIALVLYVLLAWAAVRMVGWLARICVFTRVTTKVLQVLCMVFFVLLPTWDIIPSRLYFQHLCKSEAGVKVLKTVELDGSYFRSDGIPDDQRLRRERYSQADKRDHKFSQWSHIVKVESSIQDKQSGEILGIASDFVYYGGWLGASIAPMSSVTCPTYPNHIVHSMIWQEIFKPKQPSSQGGN